VKRSGTEVENTRFSTKLTLIIEKPKLKSDHSTSVQTPWKLAPFQIPALVQVTSKSRETYKSLMANVFSVRRWPQGTRAELSRADLSLSS
jgi:hypothetical protein